MFDFHNNATIKSHKELQQAKMLGSFKSEDKGYQASLVKGLTQDDFNDKYPASLYESFSFQAIEKFKTDLKKANEDDLIKAETEIQSATSGLSPVVLEQAGGLKKLVYVRKKD
jgi:uncharacterized protein (DUF2249 family)